MKNWLPVDAAACVLAIATVPSGHAGRWLTGRFSSAIRYAGPPAPVPDGSPHCGTKMPVVVIRWQEVLSKKCLLARYVKLLAVHGAFAVSTATLITPRFVVIVIVSMPDLGSPAVGG